MQKLEWNHPETQSQDIIQHNLEQLKILFPEAFTEGKIDFEVLKQLLGEELNQQEEKYGFNWHGKRAARRLALTPSTGTLRPCPEDSLDWDTTQNLMIEGDNLEVLKLLQKSYAGKIKMIYIDPPYNTGNDFVYKDDFKDNITYYKKLVGLIDESGEKLSSLAKNSDSSGRFHTDWLNMMYPRLKLARALLRDDGIFFASINNAEVTNLKKICDEIFGEENFLQQLVWKQHAGGGNDARHFASDHEYILVYCKNIDNIGRLRMPLSEEDKKNYTLTDKHIETLGPYKTKSFRRMRPDDPRPGLTYEIVCPDGTKLIDTWKWEKTRFLQALEDEKVLLRQDKAGNWQVEYKIYLYSDDSDDNGEKEEKKKVPRSLLLDVERNAEGKRQLRDLFGVDIFSNPKPLGLIEHLLSFGSDNESIILDFFAGSGTTGHAVMNINLSDNGKRKFILVQLPEIFDPNEKETTALASKLLGNLNKPLNIAELTKERLRRASLKIKKKSPLLQSDLGFRAFKLDSSNIRAWTPDPENLPKTLEESVENIKVDGSENDILYELLLKLGLDLCIPIENHLIAEKNVYVIGGGVLFVCLVKPLEQEVVERLAMGIVDLHKELHPVGDSTFVFLDSAFDDDISKTNLSAILQQFKLENIRFL